MVSVTTPCATEPTSDGEQSPEKGWLVRALDSAIAGARAELMHEVGLNANEMLLGSAYGPWIPMDPTRLVGLAGLIEDGFARSLQAEAERSEQFLRQPDPEWFPTR